MMSKGTPGTVGCTPAPLSAVGHVEPLVSVQSKEGCCPPNPRDCSPFPRNFGLGWKEENGWWNRMANSWYWIGNQGLTPMFGFSLVFFLDGPHCSLGFYIHSDSCSTAFWFWDIFSSRKKSNFFFPQTHMNFNLFQEKISQIRAPSWHFETQITILTCSLLSVVALTGLLSELLLKALVSL